MRRSVFSASATILGLMLFLALSPAASAADIVIQPKAISLDCDSQGSGSVSVHTDIPYDPDYQVTLVEPNLTGWAKSDDCGRLVGKFSLAALEAWIRTLNLGNGKEERSVTLTFQATLGGTTETHTGTGTVIITRDK